jgi:PleD family two-component response regulator
MTMKQSLLSLGNRFEPRGTDEGAHTLGPERQINEGIGKTERSPSVQIGIPAKPRILIVMDDDSISIRLKAILRRKGFVSECARSMAAACESAKSGRFPVVVSAPVLFDGSWNRLVDVEGRCTPGFVIILVASTFDHNQWARAVEDGAFVVVDAARELPKVALAARCALWAAYLKGSGPNPEGLVH